MLKCYECGKKIRFWNCYRHPILGYKIYVCGKCFEELNKSMENYRDFILNEFKNYSNNKIIGSKVFKLINLLKYINYNS